MRTILLLALLAAHAMALAAPQTYTVDPRHSHVTWAVLRAGASTFRGKIVGNTGRIVLDPQAHRGEIDIEIDMRQQATGVPGLDRQMQSPGLFDTAQFPTARFVARKLTYKGAAPDHIDGELTLRGVTRPVTLTVNRFACGKHPAYGGKDFCGADAYTVIHRSEWGMTSWQSLVGDDVVLDIAVEAFPE
jgi:polyisoprenoid-binding protein YceI